MKKTLFFLFCFSAIEMQAQTTGYVNGQFMAPPATTVVLQNNNADPLSVLTKKDPGSVGFKFLKPLAKGAKYKVSVKSVSPGMATRLTYAQGIIPIISNTVTVECDYKFDLLSRSSTNTSFSTFYESGAPVVAGDSKEEGRFVAFVSNSANFCGITGKYRQIFWRDRNTGITKLISTSPDGKEGTGDSNAPSMSTDGHTVAFESNANDLVEGDKNGVRDVFTWSSETGKILRVSMGPGDKEANGESFEPSLANGEIAYTSRATNLVAGVDAASMINVYWRNLITNEQKMLSVSYLTKKGVGGSKPSINQLGGDSTRIAFSSASPDLVPGDKNNLWDIFVYSKNKPLKRISLTYNGGERNQGTESGSRDVMPSISGNGRYVAFATTATNVVAGDNNNAQDVFVADMEKDTVIRVSVANGKEGNGDSPIGQGEKIAISFDGSWTAFNSKATNLGAPAYNFIMHHLQSGETRAVTTGSEGCLTSQPVMSINGSYVVFGMCPKLDTRFSSSGLFAAYTTIAGTRFNNQSERINK